MKLKKYLKKNKITQRSFSKELGITHVYFNLIVSGKARPSPDLADRIEKATDGAVTFIELLRPDEAA